MEQRISRKKFKIYAFDIESHNDVESIIKNETSMWLGCLIDDQSKEDDESIYFDNMDSFIDRLEELSNPKRKSSKEKKPIKNICVYIYNLSFEWSFILPILLKRGYKFSQNVEEGEYCYNSVSTKTCSSVWCCKLKASKNGGIIILKDLAKIYGGGLSKVAKSFNLPTQKGEINYRLNRLREENEAKKFENYLEEHKELYQKKGIETWKNICEAVEIPLETNFKYNATKEEKNYIFKDVRIIIDILLIMQQKGDKQFFNVSSMASYSMKKLLQTGFPRALKPYQEYRKLYPNLGAEENEFLRKGVSGGITYALPKYQFVEINQQILHIDAHQMHPTQGYKHKFPYGEGTYFEGKPTMFFGFINCCRIRVSYTGVKMHSIIQLIGIDFIDDFEITIWDFELPTMRKVYENLQIEFIDGYYYKCRVLPWRNYYKDNYLKRLEAKKNKDDFNVLYYKLLNNSSYGKHLEKPHNQIFKNVVNFEGVIDSEIEDKEQVEANAKYTYLPVGSCIPAYSRVQLIETALLFGWENVIYFDTDSIFCIYNEHTKAVWESDKIDKTDFLGGWSLEEISERGQFTAPKRYKLEVDGEAVIKAGGINFNEYIREQATIQGIEIEKYQVSFDEINITSSSWKVQRAYRVKGGTIIDFQLKEMSVPKKYVDIYETNMLK